MGLQNILLNITEITENDQEKWFSKYKSYTVKEKEASYSRKQSLSRFKLMNSKIRTKTHNHQAN